MKCWFDNCDQDGSVIRGMNYLPDGTEVIESMYCQACNKMMDERVAKAPKGKTKKVTPGFNKDMWKARMGMV